MKTTDHETARVERILALARLDVPNTPTRESILSAATASLDPVAMEVPWMPVLRFALCACACLWLVLALPEQTGVASAGLPPIPATDSPLSRIRRPSPTAARDLTRWTSAQDETLSLHPSLRSL